MANLCGNKLLFYGPKRQVRALETYLLTAISVIEANVFTQRVLDLNKIIPIPKGLPEWNASVSIDRKMELIKKFGHWNDLDWRIENWGQRWDLIEVVAKEEPARTDGSKAYQGMFRLVSNAKPLIPVLEFLSRKFPLVGFVLVFDEGGNDLYGASAFINDEQIDEIFFSADELMSDISEEDPEWYEKREERALARLEEIEEHLLDRLRLESPLGWQAEKKPKVESDEQGAFSIPLPENFEVMIEG